MCDKRETDEKRFLTLKITRHLCLFGEMANLSTAGKTLANAQFMAHSKLNPRFKQYLKRL